MDPLTLQLTQFLISAGYAAYVPLLLAFIGLFSVVATVYPTTWKGAAAVHKLALLLGNAKPANPAMPPTTSETK